MTHSKRFEIITTLAMAAMGLAISGYLWLYGCARAADGTGCTQDVPRHWYVMAFLFWFLLATTAMYALTAVAGKPKETSQ